MTGDIFREVDEALREDKVKVFWHRWRYLIVGAAVAIVVIVGIAEMYGLYQERVQQMRVHRWQEILQLPEYQQGAEIEEFVAAKYDIYAVFAHLHWARQKISKGEIDQAILALNQIIIKAEPIYAALARIEKAVIFFDDENYIEGALVLEPLLEESKPFRALALYYSALGAFHQKNYPTVQALTETLMVNPAHPPEIQNLARQLHNQAAAFVQAKQ